MENFVVNNTKIPLDEEFFLYVHDGDFKMTKTFKDADDAAHSVGNGEGAVYNVKEFETHNNTEQIRGFVTKKLPLSDTPFSGKAALRHEGAVNCKHKKTEARLEKAKYEHWSLNDFTFVTCRTCFLLLSKTEHVSNEFVGNYDIEHYVGFNPPITKNLTYILSPYDGNAETLQFDGTSIPLILRTYGVQSAPKEDQEYNDSLNPWITTSYEEAKLFAYTEGDGSLEGVVSELYQYVSEEVSYEIETTVIVDFVDEKPENLIADKVASLKQKRDQQKACSHANLSEEKFLTEGDSPTLEFTKFSCVDCGKWINDHFYVDTCQPHFTEQLLTRSEEQKACSHKTTTTKETPNGYLGCLILDTDLTVYCTKCDALLYTIATPYEVTTIDIATLTEASTRF